MMDATVDHTDEKSNKCNQCDYATSRAGDLRRHLKTHSGEKPNKCNQCDFASSHASDLRRHLKTHIVALILPVWTHVGIFSIIHIVHII